jgi:hypothetical protein
MPVIVTNDKDSYRIFSCLSKEKVVWKAPKIHSSDLLGIIQKNGVRLRRCYSTVSASSKLIVEV